MILYKYFIRYAEDGPLFSAGTQFCKSLRGACNTKKYKTIKKLFEAGKAIQIIATSEDIDRYNLKPNHHESN